MADRSSERDRRVRELLRNKTPGFDVIGQAQAEIQDAQSELYNHVALQQAQDQSRLREMGTISQAAGGMMAMENQGDQLQYQASQMNPTTQATLSKFGVKPSQNTQRNTINQRVVTKSGDTTNIRNESITNNRTDIKITQPSIPMSQSVIPMRGNVSKEDNTSKFKAWLSGMFARQQNEADIQKKEYRKKEWALGRTTSKLMKKIGEATAGLSNKLDPKNMTSTLGGQLKWLLLIFGATMIAKVWKPAMNFIANLDAGFRAVFGLPINEDLRNTASGTLSVMDQIKNAIGISRGEDTSLIQGIGRVFMQGIDKLIDKIGFWFEDRKVALGEVEFPSTGDIDFGALGGVLGPAMDGVVSALKGVGQYLGDLITVAFGGSKGKVKVEARRVQRQAQEVFTNTKGKQTSAGDTGLVTGKGRNYMRDSDYDTFGNLKGNASSTQAMSQSLISMFNDRSGKAHTAEITTGVSQLFGTAQRNGQVVIDPELLKYLGLGQNDITTLQRDGMLTQKQYRIIAVEPNQAQKDEMATYNESINRWGATLTGIGVGAYAGAKMGAAGGSFFGPWGTAIGGVGGALVGGITGGVIGYGAGTGVDQWLHNISAKGLYPKLVPAESNEIGADGSKGIPKMLWVLDKRGADAVKGKITHGMTNKDTDLTNKEFYDFIRKRGEIQARRNGITLGAENLSTNNLQVAQSQLDVYNREWYDRYESNDPNSYNQQHFRNWNAAVDTASGLMSQGASFVSNGFSSAAGFVRGLKIGKPQQNQRAAYLMKLAMKYGFTKEQAAGIAGNAMRESGMITETAYTSNDAGQGPGGGLVGWLGENCKQVLRYAKDLYGCNVNPENVSDIKKVPFETQADILMRQLTGDLEYSSPGRGKKAGDAIKAATSVSEAVYAMERKFEVSGDYRSDPNLTKRNEFANGFVQMDITTVDLSKPALGSPIMVGSDDMMVGKSGSTPQGVKNWLWGGTAPVYYNKNDESRAYSLQTRVRIPIHDLNGNEGTMNITVNKLLAENVASIFQNIFQNVPEFKIDSKTTGGFCFRRVNSGKGYSNKLSNHSFGGAIDINWNLNPLHDTNTQDTDRHMGTTKHPVVQIFYQHGWIWGGVWSNKDKMHFEYGGGTTGGNIGGGGIVNDFLDGVADILDTASEITNPNKPDDSTLLTRNLTPEQKAATKTLDTYNQLTDQVNVGSLLRVGAKVDSHGVYIEGTNGTNLYLKDSATALGGQITNNDIKFVGRINQQTGKLEGVTADEEKLARDSISVTASSMFSTYKGKGSISDRMLNSKNQVIKFYLGKFKDIGGFSDFAQRALRGSIEFYISPTKDASNVAYIEISPVFSSGLGVTQDNTESREWGKVGPCIYDKGRQWYNPWGSGLITSDWSPTSTMHRVRLTPEAEREKQNLFRILSFGKIFEKDGKLYKSSDGKVLSDQDYEDAKKYKILTGQYYRDGMSEDLSKALGEAKQVALEGGKFNTKNYFEDLGIEFKDREKFFKEHKDIFRVDDNGDIVGPGGIIWGKGSIDKPELFGTEQDFASAAEALGNEGIKRNNETNQRMLSISRNAAMGLVDQNAVGDFIKTVGNVDLIGKDKDLADKVNKDRSKKTRVSKSTGFGMINGKRFKYFIFSDVQGNIDFYKISKQGLLDFIKEYSGKEIFDSEQVPEGIKAANLDDLYTKLINVSSKLIINSDNDTYEVRKARENGDTNKLNSLIENKKNEMTRVIDRTHSDGDKQKRPTYDKLHTYLVNKGKYVERVDTPNKNNNPHPDQVQALIVYQGGEEEKKKTSDGYWFGSEDSIPQTWIDNINELIKQNKKDIDIAAGVKYFNNSGYQASLSEIRKKAMAGEEGFEVDYNDDGTVSLKSTGQVIDSWDTSKEKPKSGEGYKGKGSITTEDLQENETLREKIIGDPVNFFKDENNKIMYYQKYYGAIWEGDGLWVYSKDRNFRTKINLNADLKDGGSKKDALLKNSTQAWDSSKKKWVNLKGAGYVKYDEASGSFQDTGYFGSNLDMDNENDLNTLFNRIADGIDNVDEGMDLNNARQEIIAGNTNIQVTAEQMAARQRNKQAMDQAKILAKNSKQVDLLEIIANKEQMTPEQIAEAVQRADKNYNNTLIDTLENNLKNNGVEGVAAGTSYVRATDSTGRKMLFTYGSNNRIWTYEQDSDGKTRQVSGGTYQQKGNQIIVTNGDSTVTYNINGSGNIGSAQTTPAGQ